MSNILFKHLTRKQEIAALDRIMMVAAFVHPLTASPQVYQIYATQDAEGVSLMTWLGFMVLGMVFLTYALVHKIKPMIVTQILWYVVDTLIVVGVVLYG